MCQQAEQLKKLIADLIPLAEAGEYHTGGRTEAEAKRNAEALAQARKAVKK